MYEQIDSIELCCCLQTTMSMRIRSNFKLAHDQVIISNEFNFKLAYKQIIILNKSDSELFYDWVEFLHCFRITSQFSNCFRWHAAFITQKKTDMLQCSFFLKKLQMNLNNMKNFEYKQAVKSFSQIIKNDILNIMNKQKKFNVFNINEIFNIFFKAMKKLFAEIIITFT